MPQRAQYAKSFQLGDIIESYTCPEAKQAAQKIASDYPELSKIQDKDIIKACDNSHTVVVQSSGNGETIYLGPPYGDSVPPSCSSTNGKASCTSNFYLASVRKPNKSQFRQK